MPCNIVFSNTPQPCGNPTITSYEVEIRATGNIEGVADPSANPAGEVLATWSDTVLGGSMASGDPKWVAGSPSVLSWSPSSAFTGTFSTPSVDDTLLQEDIEVCHRVTNACGTSEWVCDVIIAVPPIPVSFIATDDSNLVIDGTSEICLGGKLDQSGSIIPLDLGDLLHITIPEIALDVELVVGQDPLTPAGYQNDIGTELWANMIPYMSTSDSFDPTTLLVDNYCLSFNKHDWAFDSSIYYGFGNSTPLTINNEVVDVSNNTTDVSTDSIINVVRSTSDNSMKGEVYTTPVASTDTLGVYPTAYPIDIFLNGGAVWITDNSILPAVNESACNPGVIRQFFVNTQSPTLTGDTVRIVEWKFYDQAPVLGTTPTQVFANDERPQITALLNSIPGVYPISFGNYGPYNAAAVPGRNDSINTCGPDFAGYCCGGPGEAYYGNYWMTDFTTLPLTVNLLEYAVFEVTAGTEVGEYWKVVFTRPIEF